MKARWAIFRTYFMRSWMGVVYTVCMFGLCYWTSFAVERIEPVLVMAYFLIAIVSSRLNALTTYSLAFNAPDYLAQHYRVAFGILLVFAWLPAIPLGFWHNELIATLCFLSLVSGFVLFGERNAPRLYTWGTGAIFATTLLIMLFQVRLAWEPGTVAGIAGIMYGAILLTLHFRRDNKGEYNVVLSTASMVYNSQWVKVRAVADPGNEMAARLNKPGFVERIGSRFKLKPGSLRALLKMTNLGSGDWLQWQIIWFMSVVFSALVAIVLFIADLEKLQEALPRVITLLVFMFYSVMAITSVVAIPWPMNTFWIRAPVANKRELLNLLVCQKARNIGVNFVYVLLVTLIVNAPSGNFQFLLDLAILLVAVTSGGIAVALVLNQYQLPMPVASMVGIGITAAWVLLTMWLHHPLPDNELAFRLTLLVTGVAALCLTSIWWYRGFYQRRQNVLGIA
jgi:hypothetical protein